MNPAPLTDSSGTVRAYLCGVCGTLGIASHTDPEAQAARSAHSARTCCVCSNCGAPAPRTAVPYSMLCAPCGTAHDARLEASRAAWLARSTLCSDCDAGEGHGTTPSYPAYPAASNAAKG